jgi:hypothetical protein
LKANPVKISLRVFSENRIEPRSNTEKKLGRAPDRTFSSVSIPSSTSRLRAFAGNRRIRIESTILHFALPTDDCAAILEKGRDAGAEVTMETKDLTIDSSIGPVPVRIAFFKRPDGEVIELFQNSIL